MGCGFPLIVQTVLDFFRDSLVTWIGGLTTAAAGLNLRAAGAAVGGVAAQAGHFLALFVSPGVWGAVSAAWGVWLSVWALTALVAIIARRGTSS